MGIELSKRVKMVRIGLVVAFFFGGYFSGQGALGVILSVVCCIAGALFMRDFQRELAKEV